MTPFIAKVREYKCMKRGEITAFLSLVFVLLVSFTGGMLDVTSIQLAKNMGRVNMERAMECVFAEYQKELLDRYDVFALDASYETGIYSENMIMDRLDYYSGVNTDKIIERIQFLSDNEGTPFFDQVNYYMKHKYGMDVVEDKLGMTDIWEKQDSSMEEYELEIRENDRELSDLLLGNNSELPEQDNSIVSVAELKKSPVLELVMPKDRLVSEKRIDTALTVSNRTRVMGYGDFTTEEESHGSVEKLLFGKYILEHFDTATDQTGNILEYETEYILAGESSDRENLKEVVQRLIGLRFVANYTYLLTSPEKTTEARAAALAISTALAMPAITEAATQGMLLAWAYGESVMDLKTLLKGNKVPLVKDGASWQLSLSGLITFSESQQLSDGEDCENGMDYEEYLQILLFLENRETLTLRALDLIEMNLQKICGLDFLKVDHCVTKIGIKSTCTLRRGITYSFPQYFGYI